MYSHFRKPALIAGLALTLAATGAIAGDSLSQDVVEARQETQIWTTYALNPHLRAHDLKVSVDKGRATLTGKVDEEVNKDLARQIALGVGGVTEVNNQIVVDPAFTPPARAATERSYGEAIDDATMTAAIKSKLLWSTHTDGLTTGVESRDGKVTLTGTAGSRAAKDSAGRLALNTRGVTTVNNLLMVTAPRAIPDRTKNAAENTGADIADSWITTKVKSTFMYSSNVDGSDITVSTSGGDVTLSGKVDSGAERALAIELARNVRGVKHVNSKGLTI